MLYSFACSYGIHSLVGLGLELELASKFHRVARTKSLEHGVRVCVGERPRGPHFCLEIISCDNQAQMVACIP